MKRGEVWVSVVIYTLIAATALAIILQGGLPLLNRMKDRSVYSKMKETMINLDKHMTELTYEGEGSQRVVGVELREGVLNAKSNYLYWEFATDEEIITPRTSTSIGNLVITSNANVRTIDNGTYYLLENTIGEDVLYYLLPCIQCLHH